MPPATWPCLLLAAVLAVHLLLQALRLRHTRRLQNAWLLLCSYAFASWFSPGSALVLLGSTVATYGLGRSIATAPTARLRSRWLWLAIATQLGLLAYFKYRGFFADNARELLAVFGAHPDLRVERIWLPLGLSFYTFQNLGYCLDVYRGHVAAERDPLDFALFVAFFPKLSLGPIERASTLLPQIRAPRPLSLAQLHSGAGLLLLGAYKKIAVADPLAALTDPLFAIQPEYRSGDVLAAALLFTLQLYADFSGYTDMARGASRMLGFELSRNFQAPYLARNVQVFWSRWHITLSSWVNEHLFQWLATSGRWARVLGTSGLLLVTMAVMGLWHGATWMFVAWGLYHGLWLCAFHRVRPFLYALEQRMTPTGRGAFTVAGVALTFAIVVIGELLFRPADIGQSAAMLRAVLLEPGMHSATLTTVFAGLRSYWLVLVLDLAERRTGERAVESWPPALRTLLYGYALFEIFRTIGGHPAWSGEAFHYLRF